MHLRRSCGQEIPSSPCQVRVSLPVLDLGVVRWLRDLDENEAVGLARALIHAEAGRLGMPLEGFSMSGRVKARDEGIDGRTAFGEGASLLPGGDCVWQVKSGSSVPLSGKEFDEQKHAGLFAAVRNGADYVLFWTNDPPDPTGTSMKERFQSAVRDVRSDAVVHFLFADEIQRLCLAHLGVLAQLSPIPLGGVVSLDVWATGTFRTVAFQADQQRENFMDVLRQHMRSEAASAVELHVVGDTGVGKSRLVYEAAAIAGIAERVLVAPDATSLDRSLLSLVAQSSERRLVLVVDDCEPEDRSALVRFAGMAQGRLRLVTIGSRSLRGSSNDLRYLELGPLALPASREIALSVALDEHDAGLVAEYTEGYPGLAFTLADAIRNSSAPASLVDRVRGHERVGSVLSSLLPDESYVSPLGMLSLFERLGFDAEYAPELTLACDTLGVDERRLRTIAEQERDRFVSTAGRFRRVTPKLFALWLASRFIDEHHEVLRTALTQLPDSLRQRILDQMSAFAGDPAVGDALAGLLDAPPFTTGALGDEDGGAAHLLHVAAVAAPEAAMDAIDRVLDGVSIEDLQLIGTPRRELVWALEVLAWFDELFDRAADALLRLAIAENETWSNNATGVLQGLFHIHLGGTAAPYQQRVDWARSALAVHGDAAVPLFAVALRNAFDPFEARTSTDFGGRAAPTEWRPSEVADEIAARGQAWDLLLEIARSHPEYRDAVAEAVAGSLRLALQRGLAERVLNDLRGLDWSAHARGELGEAIGSVLQFDDPPDPMATELRGLQSELRGTGVADRIAYVLTQPPWDLIHDDDEVRSGRPKLVLDLAHELAEAEASELIEAVRQSHTGDPQTVGMFFEAVAQRRADDDALALVEAQEPLPVAALLGAFGGLARVRDEIWADDTLERWLGSRELAAQVVAAVHLLAASPERVTLAIEAVDRGAAPAHDLARFLYGGWAGGLPEQSIVEILDRLRAAPGNRVLEHALGILSHWLDQHENAPRSPALTSLAVDLLDLVTDLPDRPSPMLNLYRSRVVQKLGLGEQSQLDTLLKVLRSLNGFPTQYDLELFDSVASSDPRRTVEAVVRELANETGGFRSWVMWAEDAKLLSRLAHTVGADLVEESVLALVPADQWRSIVKHFDFTDGPDQVVAELISRSDDEVFLARAAWQFMYPESGFVGSEADQLKGRRTKLKQLCEEVDVDSPVRTWLDGLLGELNNRIRTAEQNDAERPS